MAGFSGGGVGDGSVTTVKLAPDAVTAAKIAAAAVQSEQIDTDAVTNSKIANPSLTVAGNAVSLGGSASIGLPDLSDYPVNVGDLGFSGTQTSGKSGGYESQTTSVSLESNQSPTWSPWADYGDQEVADGMEVTVYEDANYPFTWTRSQIEFADGSTETVDHTDYSVSTGAGSITKTVPFAEGNVARIRLEFNSDYDSVGIQADISRHLTSLPTHSHQL